MRKTSLLLAAFSLLALGSAANAEDDMKMPAPAKPAPAAAKPKPSPQHQQGMQHGGAQMHDQMMKDHTAGTAAVKGMKDSPPQADMKMGCSDGAACKDKMPGMAADKPADAPMPMMKDHM
jgi:hypothetical protein